MKPRVCLTTGDPSGIGGELVVKLLSTPGMAELADISVIGSRSAIGRAEQITGARIPLVELDDIREAPRGTGLIHFLDLPIPGPYQPGVVGAASGWHTLDSLGRALDLALSGDVDAVCFAPLNKESLRAGGNQFEDELSWMADRMGLAGFVCEINALKEVWTSRVSSHVPMRDVHRYLTVDRVLSAIALLDTTMRDNGSTGPRLAVCGFNAHAGDGGLLGNEEIEIIRPAIEMAREFVRVVDGPFPADTIFLRALRDEYDGVVTMFHDQGQIALKLLGFDRGVSIQGGLPVPVTTCAHGTAFDIVGQNRANVSAFRHAFEMACRMGSARRVSTVTAGEGDR